MKDSVSKWNIQSALDKNDFSNTSAIDMKGRTVSAAIEGPVIVRFSIYS